MIRRNQRQAGFTLIELMVSLVAGMLVIASIYSISGSSSRLFAEQQRVAHLQMNVRFAMERMRHDIARAGFGGVPDTTTSPACVPPAGGNFQALVHQDTTAGDSLLLPGGNSAGLPVELDRLTMVGNYGSDTLTSIETVGGGGGVIIPTASNLVGDLDLVYPNNSFVHVVSPQGNHFFLRVTGRTGPAGARTGIQVNPGLPQSGCGNIQGGWMSPLNQISYRVANPGSVVEFANVFPNEAADVAIGQGHTFLIREEQPIGTGIGGPLPARVAGTFPEIVLDDVVTANYQFVTMDEPAPGAVAFPNDPVVLDGPGAAAGLAAALQAGNNSVASVIVTLAAHSRTPEPRVPFTPPAGPGAPLTSFWTWPTPPGGDGVGATRVRELRAEVFTPNLAP